MKPHIDPALTADELLIGLRESIYPWNVTERNESAVAELVARGLAVVEDVTDGRSMRTMGLVVKRRTVRLIKES